MLYSDYIYIGLAYRRCLQDATWDELVNVTQCHNTRLMELNEELQYIVNVNNDGSALNLSAVQSSSEELLVITNASRGNILPNDLDSTIRIIDSISRWGYYAMIYLFDVHVCPNTVH